MAMITTRSLKVKEILETNKFTGGERHDFEIQKNWEALRRGSLIKTMPDYNLDSSIVGDVRDGMWDGERCFIIGGGPSLKGFDFSKLKAERTIGINRAFEYLDPSIIFWADYLGFYAWLIDNKLSKRSLETFHIRTGKKVALNSAKYEYPESIQTIPVAGQNILTKSLQDGLGFGGNTGYAALNLAVCLGANPIYLLGFDMNGTGNKKQNWFHNGYPNVGNSKAYADFIVSFDKAGDKLKAMGINVYNLNPKSKMKTFPFRTLDKIRPALRKPTSKTSRANPHKKKWMIISYYTEGTSYEKEVECLIESLKRFKLPYKIYAHKPMGSWRANLNHKSACILEALEAYPNKDIVFVDSDAIVRADPVLLDRLSEEHKYDIAATFHKYAPESGDPDELLSGTLWMQNHKQTHDIVERWHKIGLAQPGVRHQRCLKMAIAEMTSEGVDLRVYRMPFEYTCIFDYARARGLNPVIEHFQASRRFRAEVGYGRHLIT